MDIKKTVSRLLSESNVSVVDILTVGTKFTDPNGAEIEVVAITIDRLYGHNPSVHVQSKFTLPDGSSGVDDNSLEAFIRDFVDIP